MTTNSQTHILIAEDDERLLTSVEFLFHRKGYRVTKAKTGREALEIASTCRREGIPVNLLVTDVLMPDMNGESLVCAIRNIDTHLPILVMTGIGTKALVRRLHQLGCNEYIDKPFGLDQIEARAESLLAQGLVDASTTPAP